MYTIFLYSNMMIVIKFFFTVFYCSPIIVFTSEMEANREDIHKLSRQFNNLMLYGSYGSFLLPQQQQQQIYQRDTGNVNSPLHIGGSTENVCQTENNMTGTCLTDTECEELGGKDYMSCDSIGEICCVVEKSCRNVSGAPVSYFVNPSYPNQNSFGSFCDFRIIAKNDNICQIRLDFDDFSMMQPHRTMGICRKDRFIIMTSPLPNGNGLSELCGENSGQHIYIPVDSSSSDSSVSLMVMASGQKPYKWKIKATQIDCSKTPDLVAPAGCLQYHTKPSGQIYSFNYNNGDGFYQSNLDYAVCIKRSPMTCQIRYRQVEGSKFWISSIDGSNIEDGIGRTGTLPCDTLSHDYLHIPDGRGGGTDEVDAYGDIIQISAGSSDKFCGRSLSGFAVIENAEKLRTGYILDPPDNTSYASTVTSYVSGPIVLRFHSDENTEPKQEIGFHITYHLQDNGCARSERRNNDNMNN